MALKSNYDLSFAGKPKTNDDPKDPKYPKGGTGVSNYYSLLADYYKQQNDEAKNAALKAIQDRLKANTDMYNTELKNSNNAYQNLINQNEVNGYRTQASIREALANRGQLDTGLGRQEMLNATASNTANLNNINLEKQSAANNIQNLIAQLKAQATEDEANVKSTYTQALADWVANQK